jgi:hypothetical protein
VLPYIRIDLKPFKSLSRLALVQHHLLGALLGRGRVQPFASQFGISTTGRRSWMPTMPPALSAVMITKPSCSPEPSSASGSWPMAAH